MKHVYIWALVVLLMGWGATVVALAEDQPAADIGGAIVDKVYGDVLLRDEALGLIVAVKRANGKVVSVQIDNYKNAVNLRLDVRGGGLPPQVTYSRGTFEPPVVGWVDLNADGIFDRRTAIGHWPNWDPGAFAFQDGRWVVFRRIQPRKPGEDWPEDAPEGLVDGKPSRFNLVTGKWEPLPAKPAVPATRPAR